MSNIMKTKLKKSVNKNLKFCQIKVLFKATNKLKNYLRFKVALIESMNFRAEASYIGKLNGHMKVRVSEHQSFSPRTGKLVKGALSTSLRFYSLICYHQVAWEDFKILGNESNKFILELKESLSDCNRTRTHNY